MNVQIYSRAAMEERLHTGPLESKTAVISFYDPVSRKFPGTYAPIDYSGQCDRIMQLAVHDVDLEVLPEFGLTFETYFPEAPKLSQFIKQAFADGFDIICQCEYGQSRSAACAAAIQEYYFKDGISIFADYRYYPNQLIFNKLLSALRSTKD